MDNLKIYVKLNYLYIKEIENNKLEKVELDKLDTTLTYTSSIKISKSINQDKILLVEPLKNNEWLIVYTVDDCITYYKASKNIYKTLVSVKHKIFSIRINKKYISFFMVAYILNPYKLNVKDIFFKLDKENKKSLKLNQYTKKISNLKCLTKNIFFVKFDIDEVLKTESFINNSVEIHLNVNGENQEFKCKKRLKTKNTKLNYLPIVNRYIKDYALHFRTSIKENIIFVKRKKEEIEYDFKFRFMESKIVLNIIKIISKFIKLFKRKKINIFFEKFCSKIDEGAFDLFTLFKENKVTKNYFIINEKSEIYDRIKEIKNVVKQYSVKYYFLIFLSDNFLTTEAPNHINVLRSNNLILRKEILKKKNIFLQHGITYLKCHGKNSSYIRGKEAECDYILVSSKKEQNIVCKMLNMPKEDVLITGLPVFSKIKYKHINQSSKDKVTIMLTWKPYEEQYEDFTKSTYYKNILEIYNKLVNYIDKTNINIVAHPKVKHLLEKTNINMFSGNISEALEETKLLITDYSSVCYNSFYQGSAVIFYQPDLEIYEKENGDLILNNNEYIGYRCFDLNSLNKIFKNNIVDKKINLKNLRTKENEKMYNTINEFNDGKNINRIYNKLKDIVIK